MIIQPTATIKRTGNQSCSCVNDLKCSAVYSYLDYSTPAGCYLTDTFLFSNMECYFDIYCIQTFAITLDGVHELQPLNSSLTSIYPPNTSLAIITRELMVEQWHNSSNYSSYFEQCNPIRCTYTYVEQFDILYMITLFVSLFGGLIMVLRLLCPLLVNYGPIGFKWIRRRLARWPTITPSPSTHANGKFDFFDSFSQSKNI